MSKRKLGITVLIIVLIVGSVFGYIQFRKMSVENSVIEYLTVEENIPESDIVSSEPFIANLEGSKNYMVSIKLKDDDRSYFYYRNDDGKVVLESYVEDGMTY
ncbi:hypothetical protein NSQ77_05345 [Oceanobacillus sp. FSL K6-2867]|uniref:hypothetical protein n=1 Tax=Oceanobacillus sp. FSL K6-2867 TaxID=2954748 RepID=UPI0030DD96A6